MEERVQVWQSFYGPDRQDSQLLRKHEASDERMNAQLCGEMVLTSVSSHLQSVSDYYKTIYVSQARSAWWLNHLAWQLDRTSALKSYHVCSGPSQPRTHHLATTAFVYVAGNYTQTTFSSYCCGEPSALR